jgi:hypothetical protein
MSHRRAALYLQIPAAYCRSFGGLRWAQRGEAVEFLDGPDAGRTFAFAAEIGQFLEGLLVSGRLCPAFGSALHLLYLIGLGRRAEGRSPSPRLERLARGFREQGSPLRNAGALCAWACGAMPGVAEPPALPDLLELLNGGGWIPQMVLSHPMLGAQDYAEQPPLRPSELEDLLADGLERLSDEAIRHWLKFGRGPVLGGNALLVPLPQRGRAGSLADLEERPRLAGVTRLVERLEGALSLPPRRLEVTGLQADGYWDLTTRGSPEQILPMQFALEGEEFLRRFAERELLYFHRETPSRPAAQELVLLLDQGVRTWGDVRLVLAGAAMAMARQAARHRLAIRLVTTRDGVEAVDPAALDSDSLGDLLEASDLSPNPARPLARLLRDDAGPPRDIVLLTHPRSLAEPDVAAAACLPADGEGTRIFAVTVAGGGEIELAELRRGRPVSLGRCRVELTDATAPARPAPKPASGGPRVGWLGHVEPIPFPFRCGLLGPVVESEDLGCRFLEFDQAGERILVILRHGLLATWRVDGTDAEILPRPIVDGEVIRPIKGVIGLAGGFALLGGPQERPVLAHYDFPTRTCTTLSLVKLTGTTLWFYYPDLHTIVGKPTAAPQPYQAFDLAESGSEAWTTWRSRQAIERAAIDPSPYPLPAAVWIVHSIWVDRTPRAVELSPQTGALQYRRPSGELRSLIPMSDGSPALIGARIGSVCQGGDIMALKVAGVSGADIWFVSMARAAVIGSISSGLPETDMRRFALSRDGTRFARWLGPDQVEVRDVPGDRPPVLVTWREHLWVHFASLGRSCLLVRKFTRLGARGPHAHVLIRWDGERLEVDHDDPVQAFLQRGGVVAESRNLPLASSPWAWARWRFVRIVEHGGLRVLIDEFNHLAVQDQDGRSIVVFYVSGEEFAAWMPDGTCLGTSRLIGGEPSKAAAEHIAAALRAAERGKGGGR